MSGCLPLCKRVNSPRRETPGLKDPVIGLLPRGRPSPLTPPFSFRQPRQDCRALSLPATARHSSPCFL